MDKIGLPDEFRQVGGGSDALLPGEEEGWWLKNKGACVRGVVTGNVINRMPMDNLVSGSIKFAHQRHQTALVRRVRDAVEICGMFVFEAFLYELL